MSYGKTVKPELNLSVFVYDDDGRHEYKALVVSAKEGKTRKYYLRSKSRNVQLNGESMIIGKTNLITSQIIKHLQMKAPKVDDPAMKAFVFGHFGE